MKKRFHRKLFPAVIALKVLALSISAKFGFSAEQNNSTQRPPNFIILMGKGQGWNSTSVQMDDAVPASKSSFIQTPNLERLAKEGMRFANAYAASPRCTPSRASLLTGKTAALLRMTFVGQGARGEADNSRKLIPPQPSLELPEAELTIADLLKSAGYATAHFGKWHIGRLSPARHGFDENDGANNNGGPNPKQAYLTTEKGIDFVTRQAKAGKPFLLQISQYGGHSEAEAKPKTVETIKKRGGDVRQIGAAAVAKDVDINIGLLLKKLDDLGIAANTYVIYTTDHGTPGRGNGILNNSKGSLHEGGIRAPFIIRGPDVKAGVCSHTREQRPRQERGQRQDGGRRTQDNGEARTDVPAHPWDIILGRPTRDSITLSVLAYQPMEGFIAYETGRTKNKTAVQSFKPGEPLEIVIKGLKPDTQYSYRFHARANSSDKFTASPDYGFHTARPAGGAFTFTVQSDSHLDYNTSPKLYARTLANALADKPDFHFELGDTFMTDKYANYQDAAKQYLAQRYYFGLLCHSAPLFFALGNHDGERGRSLNGTANNMTVWSATMRKRYLPNPMPDGFYSGNAKPEPFAGQLQDYYSWEWGDALFVVLDPFWFTKDRRNDDNWVRTLGEEQYQWLRKTLAGSKSKFKFIFLHHLVGSIGRSARGGIAAARLYEWGGRNADGSDGFKAHRPGWEMPIHQLLVKHQVTAVFHGHDHLFAKEELDGIVYQEVPQPGHPRYDTPRNVAEYGYTSGEIQGSAGHLRVAVTSKNVKVDYVRSYLPEAEQGNRRNASLTYSYAITSPK